MYFGPSYLPGFYLNAINLFQISISNSVFTSPTQRQSTHSRSPLTTRTPSSPTISPTQLHEAVFLEYGKRQHNLITAPSVTQNLLHSLWVILKVSTTQSLEYNLASARVSTLCVVCLFQRHVHTLEALLLLIGRSSLGLLALARQLNSFSFDSGDEAPAIIVVAVSPNSPLF